METVTYCSNRCACRRRASSSGPVGTEDSSQEGFEVGDLREGLHECNATRERLNVAVHARVQGARKVGETGGVHGGRVVADVFGQSVVSVLDWEGRLQRPDQFAKLSLGPLWQLVGERRD